MIVKKCNPVKEYCADLVIVGGGPAGVCAALAAAQQGVETILVTDRPMLGGNSSSEVRVWTRGAVGGGNLLAEEMGIWGSLKLDNLYRNFDANPVFWDDVLLDAVLKQECLKLWLNTEVDEVELKENHLLAVYGSQQSSETRMRFQAPYFVDATGDGTIGTLAGVPEVQGEPERETLGSSILYFTRREDHPVQFVAPDYAYSMAQIEEICGRGGRIINEKMSGSDCWWFEYGGMLNTISDAQDIAMELRRLVMGVWNYIKNSGRFDADCYTLEWIGDLPGKRESRHMKTEYILTEKDIRSGRQYPDGAFYGGWYIDSHPGGGFEDAEEENCTQIPVQVYQIPLRCLYQRTVPNLIFAGRNIGTERGAFFSSRIMNTCALAGQAAGTLTAECLAVGRLPWQLTQEQQKQVQQNLLRADVFIPDVPEEDGGLAQKAVITASSEMPVDSEEPSGTLPLDEGAFLAFPGSAGKVIFQVESRERTILKGTWYLSKLPNHYHVPKEAVVQCWQVEAGRQKLALALPQKAEGKFVLLRLEPVPGMDLLLTEAGRTGILCGKTGSAELSEPCLQYSAEVPPRFYRPERVANPWGRPWGGPNQWCAAPKDKAPWLQLEWARAHAVSQVRLILDPDLSMELPSSRTPQWQAGHRYAARRTMPPHLVKRIVLEARLGDENWQQVAALDDNHQRIVKLTFPPVQATALRLRFEKTWGGAPAVYGIRITEANGT